MIFSYGNGEYLEGEKHIKGQIILGEHRLYLKGPQGDLTQTYIPLEKIERIKRVSVRPVLKNVAGLDIHVRPSLLIKYVVCLKGEKKYIADLIRDLVSRRGLKKKFLKNEWFDENEQ